MPAIDIRSGVQVAVFLAALIAILSLISGIRVIVQSRDLRFFRMRRERMISGYRRIFAAILLGLLAWAVASFA